MEQAKSIIGFAGLSHLGIVSSTAAASKGFDVICYDPDETLVSACSKGTFPVFEPGLDELFCAAKERMSFTGRTEDLARCDVVYVSLDVPTDQENKSSLIRLREIIDWVIAAIRDESALVVLSQVPPGFMRALRLKYEKDIRRKKLSLYYQVETLIFGNAVARALYPERFIVGCVDPQQVLSSRYGSLLEAFDCPILPMRYESAELAKIAINLFLISSVSTTNTLAEICEKIGAEWSEISSALRLDKRIGPHAYLSPGLGIAGGNLERDLATVAGVAHEIGSDASVFYGWMRNLSYRRNWVVRILQREVLSKCADAKVALWGIAYKPGTHSTKNAQALDLLNAFRSTRVAVYDPKAKIPDDVLHPGIEQVSEPLDACDKAHALVVITPWDEFSFVDLQSVKKSMKGDIIIDPYGALERKSCLELGFSYFRLGSRPLIKD